MRQAIKVIFTLQDSHGRGLEGPNNVWLLDNVEKLHVRVCVDDCVASTFDIAEKWAEEGTILIQDGRNVQLDDFQPGKEALLLVKYKLEDAYSVFLYSPKE